ncbi:DUF6194 family protein [Mesorhizobium sp. B263B2A]|uniref:DUF6194 family protein n=1 Tax=Mesorhizobium sp. B263B2A TaxID=2876669 RepID=UPI001CD12E1D|nr:DUF6194 family protein [Mesorhizobium sp. B263B2A]MCA0030413.1 DUF6194 family protein [Mesorhizobium sp. B263B2A]
MPIPLDTVKQDTLALGSDLHIDTTTPDLFFFRGQERTMPFATIVTRDSDYDTFSKLDAEGDFRLNMGLSRGEFEALFPNHVTRKALDASQFDYAIRDSFFPHPHYGRMRWVSVVNPDILYPQCLDFLHHAFERARR